MLFERFIISFFLLLTSFITYITYILKKNIYNNIMKCLYCKCKYKRNEEQKHSDDDNVYCKYLYGYI